MGARASVILTQGKGEFKTESPVLCRHWGGTEFHENVKEWVKGRYADDHSADNANPGNRLEPDRLFVRLVKEFGDGGYVCKERVEVDDSDYGCLYVELGDSEPLFKVVG